MTAEQIDFELDYWRQVKTGHCERYQKMLTLWDYQPVDSVLEVGTGPLLGFLPLLTAKRKYGLDPAYDIYRSSGLMAEPTDGTWLLPFGINDLATSRHLLVLGYSFDAVLSMNAIDHGNSDETAVTKMAALLKPGGRLYLHVHLRTPEQLNVGHDHCLTSERLRECALAGGLRQFEDFFVIYDRDPIEDCPYRTFVAVWEKAA